MEFIKFRDRCLIARGGSEDEWDNPVNREVVYEGECLYEEGGAGFSRSIITRTPTVYIPNVDANVHINDVVEIETEFGRTILAVAGVVREESLRFFSGIKVTRIALKQGQGD